MISVCVLVCVSVSSTPFHTYTHKHMHKYSEYVIVDDSDISDIWTIYIWLQRVNINQTFIKHCSQQFWNIWMAVVSINVEPDATIKL